MGEFHLKSSSRSIDHCGEMVQSCVGRSRDLDRPDWMHAEQSDAIGRVVFRFSMHRVPFLPRADVFDLAGGALHHAKKIKRVLSGPVLQCIGRSKRGGF